MIEFVLDGTIGETEQIEDLEHGTIGSDESYLTKMMNTKMLSMEEEYELLTNISQRNCSVSETKLIKAYTKLVISMARKYYYSSQCKVPMIDIVQEGTIGLLTAARKYDPEKRVRISVYGINYIKYAMQKCVTHNLSVVRSIKTKPHERIFEQWGKIQESLQLNSLEVTAAEFGVKPYEILEVRNAIFGCTYEHSTVYNNIGDANELSIFDMMASTAGYSDPTCESVIQRQEYITDVLTTMLAQLPERDRDIITQRHLIEDTMTLMELAAKYGVSAERIRQLEVKAFKKLKEMLIAAGIDQSESYDD